MSGPDTHPLPILSAERLTTGYARDNILQALDLDIAPERFTVLIGPNGSGKSTLLRALCRLMPAREGAVLLDGERLQRLTPRQVARRIGVLAQGANAPEGLSVRDLVQQGRYPHRSLFHHWSEDDAGACARALEMTGLTALAERALDSLSGGQRQRAWIAMTLAQETGILLLDEPTTYLDLAHQIEILDLVRQLVDERRTTAVAVLHDINHAARYADHIVAMKDGRVACQGAPVDVICETVIEDIFDVRVTIAASPVDGAPMAIPIGAKRPSHRSKGDGHLKPQGDLP